MRHPVVFAAIITAVGGLLIAFVSPLVEVLTGRTVGDTREALAEIAAADGPSVPVHGPSELEATTNPVALGAPANLVSRPAGRTPRVDTLGRFIVAETTAVQLLRAVADVPPLQRDDIVKQTYLGKWIEIRGTVRDLGRETGRIWMVVDEGATAEDIGVIVDFPPAARSQLLNLRRGDPVSLLARIDTLDRWIRLGGAELVSR